jgi:hypothetical protein
VARRDSGMACPLNCLRQRPLESSCSRRVDGRETCSGLSQLRRACRAQVRAAWRSRGDAALARPTDVPLVSRPPGPPILNIAALLRRYYSSKLAELCSAMEARSGGAPLCGDLDACDDQQRRGARGRLLAGCLDEDDDASMSSGEGGAGSDDAGGASGGLEALGCGGDAIGGGGGGEFPGLSRCAFERLRCGWLLPRMPKAESAIGAAPKRTRLRGGAWGSEVTLPLAPLPHTCTALVRPPRWPRWAPRGAGGCSACQAAWWRSGSRRPARRRTPPSSTGRAGQGQAGAGA